MKNAKLQVLWLAYRNFLSNHIALRTPRFFAFQAYCDAQSSWLRSYVLFRALKDFYHWQSWKEWPIELQSFRNEAVRTFEAQHHEYVYFYAYVQWVLDQQLRKAKVFAHGKREKEEFYEKGPGKCSCR